jgi:hypothetical protein
MRPKNASSQWASPAGLPDISRNDIPEGGTGMLFFHALREADHGVRPDTPGQTHRARHTGPDANEPGQTKCASVTGRFDGLPHLHNKARQRKKSMTNRLDENTLRSRYEEGVAFHNRQKKQRLGETGALMLAVAVYDETMEDRRMAKVAQAAQLFCIGSAFLIPNILFILHGF